MMPRTDFADPRLLTPNYGSIIPGVGQGLGVAGQFAQIYENAQNAPIRRQLAQIQLDEARARSAMRPLEMELAQLRLGEAQQQAAIPQQIIEGVEVVGGEPMLTPRNLDAGFGNIEFDETFTPRERITRGTSVAAGGAKSPFEKRETLLTAMQAEAEAEKQKVAIESARALASQRLRGREFESTTLPRLIEDAKAEGNEELAAMYQARLDKLNTQKPVLTASDFYDRRVAQLAADAGITYERALTLSRTPEGAEALSAAATANKAAAQSGFMAPRVTPAQRALITGEPSGAPVADDFGARTTDILGGGAPAYATANDVKAAFKSGVLTKEQAAKILREQFGMK